MKECFLYSEKLIKKIQKLPKLLRSSIGIGLIVIGIIGVILPIMPGLIFLFPGIALLNPKLYYKIKHRFV